MGNPKGVKRDFEQLERRRLKAAKLFHRGLSQAEVSRKLKVHRQSVSRWHQAWKGQGTKGLKKAGRAGRKPRLQPKQLEELGQGLKAGPGALGYGTGLWTTWRVADLIERQTGQKFHPGHVWRILRSLGWSCQRPVGRATQRDEPAIQRWKRVRWPEVKKKALQECRTVVFVDESGLSERPHRVRTWAPRGQTPVLQYSFNWKCLSAMAGLTVWNFYFQLFPGSIKAPQVIQFLGHLQRHIGSRLTIIWDGLPVHRSRRVREFVAEQRGQIHLEYLPAYAPELNPVEYIWGYCQQHELPNLCPKDFAQLSRAARKALGRMRRRPTLIESFWEQAELF